MVTKEARIARNARRILQYLLNNLNRGQVNTVESIIRCRSYIPSLGTDMLWYVIERIVSYALHY